MAASWRFPRSVASIIGTSDARPEGPSRPPARRARPARTGCPDTVVQPRQRASRQTSGERRDRRETLSPRIFSTHTRTTCASDHSVCRPEPRFDGTREAHITGRNVLTGGPIDFLVGTGRDVKRVHPSDRRRTPHGGRQSRIRIVHYCSQSEKGCGANRCVLPER